VPEWLWEAPTGFNEFKFNYDSSSSDEEFIRMIKKPGFAVIQATYAGDWKIASRTLSARIRIGRF